LQLWARGVDGALFRPCGRSSAARGRLGAMDDGEMIVLYVGRLAREKKLDRLAAAAANVSGIRVALVGDGPDRARLERVFADAHVPTVFTGVPTGQALVDAYCGVRSSSRPYYESAIRANVTLEKRLTAAARFWRNLDWSTQAVDYLPYVSAARFLLRCVPRPAR
jgi:glycosyltransferase involved in cell wall biosynthesis